METKGNAIRLERQNSVWVGVYEGPHRENIMELFQTDTLPCPYTEQVPGSEVLAAVQERNPDVLVYIDAVPDPVQSSGGLTIVDPRGDLFALAIGLGDALRAASGRKVTVIDTSDPENFGRHS